MIIIKKWRNFYFCQVGGGGKGGSRGDLHLLLKQSSLRGQWQQPQGFALHPYRTVTRSQHPSAKR